VKYRSILGNGDLARCRDDRIGVEICGAAIERVQLRAT